MNHQDKAELVARKLRERSIDLERKLILLTRLAGSEQEQDFAEPANCSGVGRVRLFKRGSGNDWPENPLPVDPAWRYFGKADMPDIQAQVFQNAACNWRCWYCFVPFANLAANEKLSKWISPTELVQMYFELDDRPPMIDLTGGQPDLVPEWVPWMIEEIQRVGKEQEVYLWSDDNLSGDYFWSELTNAQRNLVRSYPGYSRVACFKGFDEASFQFNTLAHPSEFKLQFERFQRLVDFGLDIYAYVTLTGTTNEGLAEKMGDFVDALQTVNRNLPLRTIPLEIKVYSPVEARIIANSENALTVQYEAIQHWQSELSRRFSEHELATSICDVKYV